MHRCFMRGWDVVMQVSPAEKVLDLVQGLGAIVWEADATTLRFSFVSQRTQEVLGYPVEVWLRDPGFRLNVIHPEDRERAADFFRAVASQRGQYELEYRALAADGHVAWLRDIVRVDHDEADRVRLRGVTVDVTARKEAEESLRDTYEHMTTLIEALPDAVYFKDGGGRWLLANPAGLRLFELEGVPCLGKTEAELSKIRPLYRDALLACARTDEDAWKSREASIQEEAIPNRDGSSISLETIKVPLFNRDGSRKGLVVVGRNVTERKRLERRLTRLADHDTLTGLFSRRHFQEDLDKALRRLRRSGVHGAVMILDLDDFKDVNDRLGHPEGDKLLKSLADLLRKRMRKADVLARLGGDEFAVLLPNTEARQARQAAERIIGAVGRHTLRLAGRSIGLTVSAGVALYPEHGQTARELLARAEFAMYRAKENGGNRAWVYIPDPGVESQTDSRMRLKRRIQEALDNDLFLPHYQPVLDLRTNQISHHELLLRMVGDEGEIIPPASFLGVAEHVGLLHLIDRWVVRRAIQTIAEQSELGNHLRLAVNLSGKAFEDKELLNIIRRSLAKTNVSPGQLALEITETIAIADINQAREFIDQIRSLGCQFALDDFGVGFSSFYNLKHLPVDYLKIDGSFIRNLPHDTSDQQVVKAIVAVARGLGKQTVAEYVGDEETLRLLREYGVDYAQGFLIGRPSVVRSEVYKAVASPQRAPADPAPAPRRA